MTPINLDFTADIQVINFTIKCNDTWPDFTIKVTKNNQPLSLIGVDVFMQIKRASEDKTVLQELSTRNGGFLIGGSVNDQLLSNNKPITLPPGKFVHDIEFRFTDQTIKTYYEGTVTAKSDVTRL